ncbi:MAG: hypothetical protein LBU84_16610 [Prevotella sp.]|jgi:hypothetical protein|nr:hypothetical protein [Prevotella sp.]
MRNFLVISLLVFLFSCGNDSNYEPIIDGGTNEVKSTSVKNYVLNRHPGKAKCEYNVGYVYNPSYDLEVVFAPALPYDVSVRVKVFMKGRNFYEEMRSPWRVVTIKAGTTCHVFDLSCQDLEGFIDCSGSAGIKSVDFKMQLTDWKYLNTSQPFDYLPFNNEDYLIFGLSIFCTDGWFPGRD